MSTTPPVVLFVCVHNAGRSQIAAGYLQALAGDRVEVRSAGSQPKDQINPVAVQVMAEEGIDIANNAPKVLTVQSVQESDVVITMGCGDACPIYPGKRYEDWQLDDPAGQDVETVRRIRDEIREGRSFRSAVPRGWARARKTILSGNAVSFLAAAVLYFLAVGQVKGFAFTLGLTTILDVVVVFLIGAVVDLSSADLAANLGLSLLTSAGALTIVLGFAARNVLGNIMASLQIALNQSARVGDRVVYKGELCHVERINMTFVQLRNWDSTRLIVPVEEFASETFSNWTLQDPAMLRVLKLKLDPRADIDMLRRTFKEVLNHVATLEIGQNLGDLDDSSVSVADQDIFGILVWFSIPCRDPNTSWEVACAVRERLLAEAARIERETGNPVFPSPVAAGAA